MMSIIRFTLALTQLVIEGKKDMTRRLTTDRRQYEVGEKVALAEAYGFIWRELNAIPDKQIAYMRRLRSVLNVEHPSIIPAWENKLFVRPELMRYQIEITGKRTEHLQDISDEDILREGVFHGMCSSSNIETGETGDYTWLDIKRKKLPNGHYHVNIKHNVHSNIRECFIEMINNICGKGTWEQNPEVYVYTFKLIDTYPDYIFTK
jgi:hypothetical protein